MTPMLKQVLRFVTFSIGLSAASFAFAVATVTVTPTGPQFNETTLKLTASDGGYFVVGANKDDPNTYTTRVTPGDYVAQVLVNGKPVGEPKMITLKDGPNQVTASSDGTIEVSPPSVGAQPAMIGPLQLGRVWATFNGGSVNGLNKTGVGTNAAESAPLLNGEPRVTTYGGTVALTSVKNGVENSRFTVDFANGNRTASTQVPSDVKYGYTYFQRSPSDSTGLIVPGGGANVNLKTTYSTFGLTKALPYPFSGLQKELERAQRLFGEPMIGWRWSQTKYDGSIMNLTVPDISSTTNQKVTENDLALGYGLRFRNAPLDNNPPPGTVTFWTGAGVGANYYWAKYNGSQHNLCSICMPTVRDFTVSNSDSKNGWAFDAWADAGVGFQLGRDVQLRLGATYSYDSAAAVLINPVTPSDPSPHLGTDSRSSWSAQIGLEYKF